MTAGQEDSQVHGGAGSAVKHGNPPRSARRLLVSRDFGALFWGKLIGAIGAWAYTLAAAIMVYNESRSTLAVAAVGVAQFSPQLLLSPLMGSWSDRGYARAQLLTGRFLSAGVGLTLGVALLAFEPSSWALAVPVIAASGVIGIGIVLGGPAMQSVVPGLVSSDELRTAVTLNTAPMTIGRFVGPIVGAISTTTVGPAWSVIIFAATQGLFGLCLVLVRLPAMAKSARADTSKSVRGAVDYVWRNPRIRLLLIATATVSLGSEPAVTLTPALADDLSGGPELVGALTAAFGLGAAIGLVLVSTVGRSMSLDVVAIVGLGFLSGGLILASTTMWSVPSVIGFTLAGIGMSCALSMASTALQQETDPAMRGRVMGFWLMCFMGARPVSATLLGLIADFATPRVSIIATAIVVGCMALAWTACNRRNRWGTSAIRL